jgi:DNA-binding beta-propeller fold protein YncE
LDISGQDSSPGGIAFKPDGAKFYFAGGGSLDVYGYDLSTAWDISSASFNQSLDISGQDSTPGEIAFKPDGAKFYLVGGGNDNVYEYTLW